MTNPENNLHPNSEPNWDSLTDFPDENFPFPDTFKTKEQLEAEEEAELEGEE